MTGASLGTLNSFKRLLGRYGVDHRIGALSSGNRRRWTVGADSSTLATTADRHLEALVDSFASWKQAERKFIKLVRDMSEIEVTLHRPSTPSTSYILNAVDSEGNRKYGDTVYRRYVLRCCFPLRVGTLRQGASSYLFNGTAVKIYGLAVRKRLDGLLTYLRSVFGYMHERYLQLVTGQLRFELANKQYPVLDLNRRTRGASGSLALARSETRRLADAVERAMRRLARPDGLTGRLDL